jgi:hypothetical protein
MDYLSSLIALRWTVTVLALMVLWWRPWLPQSRKAVILFGLCWVIAATIEFWGMGLWSYSDVPVNIGTAIPTHLHAAALAGQQFSFAAAGGNDVDGLIAFTGQYVSLERLLLWFLPLWPAVAIHKLLVSGIAFFGTYRMTRCVGANRQIAATLAASFVFGHEFIIGPTWAHGLGYAGIPLLIWAAVGRLGRRHYWPGILGASLLYSASCLPTHAGLAALPAIPLAGLMMGWRGMLRALPAMLVLLAAIALNWHESFFAKALIAPYTLRGTGYSWATGDTVGMLRSMALNNTSLILWPLTALALLLSWSQDRQRLLWVALALALSLCSGAVLVEVPWRSIPGLALLAGLNLNNINFAAIALAPLAIALACANRDATPRWLALGLMAFAVGNMAYYKAAYASVLLSEGGMAGLSTVERLDKSVLRQEGPVRVVVVPYRLSPNMLWPAGIETLDGYYNLVLSAVAQYWDKGLLPDDPSKDLSSGFITFGQSAFDLKCCQSYDLGKYVDLDLLRAANVGFVLSTLPLEGLEQVSGPRGPAPTRRSQPLPQRIKGYFNEIFSPPEIRVYRLGRHLPRVYAANGVIDGSALSVTDKIAAIRSNALHRIVVADGPIPAARPHTDLMITSVAQGGDRVTIGTSSATGGIAVINMPWTPFWTAHIDGRASEIVPVNMVQMAVAVPPGTATVHLEYRRPTIHRRLMRKD